MTGRTCTQPVGDTSLVPTEGTTEPTERMKNDQPGNPRGGGGVIDYLDADRLVQIGRVQKFIAKINNEIDPEWDTLRFEWRLVDDDAREILARGDFGEWPELGPEKEN